MKIKSCIVCDDIRQEVENKVSLMGIYNDSIYFKNINNSLKWPLVKKLCILIFLSLDDEKIDQFRLEFTQKDSYFPPVKGPVNINNPKRSIAVGAELNNFKFNGPGIIDFTLIFLYEDKIVTEFKSFYSLEVLEQKE